MATTKPTSADAPADNAASPHVVVSTEGVAKADLSFINGVLVSPGDVVVVPADEAGPNLKAATKDDLPAPAEAEG